MIVARLGVVVVAVPLAFGMGMLVAVSPQSTRPVPNFAIERSMAIVTGQATRKPHEQMISGGVLEGVRRAREARSGVSLSRGADSALPVNATIQTVGCSQVFPGTYNNVRVNQGCDFRVRGEEFIVVDPHNPAHLVAAHNDRRMGHNHCSISSPSTWPST